MTAPHFARLASRLFVRDDERDTLPLPSAEARATAIAALASVIRARRRRMVARRWAGAAVAAAAAIVVGVGTAKHFALRQESAPSIAKAANPSVQVLAHFVGAAAAILPPDGSRAVAHLAQGGGIHDGERVVTPAEGRATLDFSTGTTTWVGESSDLTIASLGATQVLQLNAGWIDLHVAKLTVGQRFIVRTSDAEVEVRGTRFRVSLGSSDPSCGDGSITRVQVTEGVVVVRHGGVESHVAIGEQWPSTCGGKAARAAVAPERATLASPVTHAVGMPLDADVSSAAPRPSRAVAAMSPPLSLLADQNDLFARGLAAKREGDVHAALVAFDRFVSKYASNAPLAENAYAERMRLLRSTASNRAAAAARQYLLLYPNGFAIAEAQAIAETP